MIITNPFSHIDIRWSIAISTILIILVIYTLLKARYRPRHYYKIRTGERVIKKLNSFEHDGSKINYLKKIDPFVFEELVLSAFKAHGFKIKRNKRYTGDGGIDGTVYGKDGSKLLIQCKRYKSYVSRKHIKDFEELINENGLKGGFFCHTGKTGADTYRSFEDSNIKLISGSKLIKLITAPETVNL